MDRNNTQQHNNANDEEDKYRHTNTEQSQHTDRDTHTQGKQRQRHRLVAVHSAVLGATQSACPQSEASTAAQRGTKWQTTDASQHPPTQTHTHTHVRLCPDSPQYAGRRNTDNRSHSGSHRHKHTHRRQPHACGQRGPRGRCVPNPASARRRADGYSGTGAEVMGSTDAHGHTAAVPDVQPALTVTAPLACAETRPAKHDRGN